MTHRVALLAIAGLLAVPASFGAQSAFLLVRTAKGRPLPQPYPLIWNGSPRGEQRPLTVRMYGKPSSLMVTRDEPEGVRIGVTHAKGFQFLPVHFGREFAGFDNKRNLKRGYVIHALEHDFDGDKIPEVVVAVGDGLVNLAVNVFRFTAPNKWTRIGSFEGQQKAIVEGGTIVLPYGSQGLFQEHRWKGGKFVETSS
jgi:hypothetical protein